VLGTDPATGKTVSVRLGRYGPFAQLGLKEDGDTPKYASLRPGQSLHTIALAEALELFKLPRVLGTAPDGVEVSAAIGRFGPFVKHGSTYASIRPPDDPYTITLERALAVLREKAEAAANRIIASFDDGAIQVLNGRYGPYVTDGTKNANVPKDTDPKTLDREACVALLAEKGKPARKGSAARKAATKKAPARRGAKAAATPEATPTTAARKAPAAKKPAVRKAAAKKATAKKATARKSAPTRAPAKKVASPRRTATKAAARGAAEPA
jgi:DNA topoisomerase-1